MFKEKIDYIPTCPQCRKKAKKHGPPQLHGHFLDQIFFCADCDWCGVETEVLDRPEEWQGVPVQGELFGEQAK